MSAIRIFRIARLFRLIRLLEGLNKLFTTFVLSLPKLMNVFMILALLLFLFSVLGVQLFAKVKFQDPHGVHANFQSFYRATMTLIRSMTGEGWNELMHSLSRNEVFFTQLLQDTCYDRSLMDVNQESWKVLKAKCLIDRPNECGTAAAYVYFIAYTCLITFVILNLVIAVILEGFDDASQDEENQVVDRIVQVWRKYDQNYVMKLNLSQTLLFVNDVCSVFDIPVKGLIGNKAIANLDNPAKLAQLRLEDVELCRGSLMISPHLEVHFIHAVKWALRVVMAKNENSALDELRQAEEEDPKLQKMEAKQVKRHRVSEKVEAPIDFTQWVAATKIQAVFRAKAERARSVTAERCNTEKPAVPRPAG